MSGKHRLRKEQQPTLVQRHRGSPRGMVVGAVVVLGGLSGLVIWGGASAAHAQGLDRPAAQRITPVPTAPLPTATAPRDTDEQHQLLSAPTNEKFLSAVAAAGISTTGREDTLLDIAKNGAASHTTDADLKQALRALIPNITDVQGDKFVLAVRQAFPGAHDQDTDDDGR